MGRSVCLYEVDNTHRIVFTRFTLDWLERRPPDARTVSISRRALAPVDHSIGESCASDKPGRPPSPRESVPDTLLGDVIPFWMRHGLDREHGVTSRARFAMDR